MSPALVGVMDLAWVRREVRKIYVRKAAQVGVSEAFRNILLHMAISEPDPVLLVLPDEKTGRRVMSKRILPLFEDTDVLRDLQTESANDQGLTQVLLANGFNLQLGWTGSAAALAADPARVVGWDETDKSKEWDGKESGVAELVDVRTATYENSLLFAMSTPTTPDAPITEMCEAAAIKLFFHCPCPACGHFQQLAFERIRYPRAIEHKEGEEKKPTPKPSVFDRITDVEWEQIASEPDKKRRAALVEAHKAAWYECERCEAAVLDRQKQRMLLAGYWGTEDGGWKLFVDGREEGAWPLGSDVAMHYPAWLSLGAKHKFYKVAAEWILCAGNEKRTQGFRNSWQGEAYRVVTQKTRPDAIRAKRDGAPKPMMVPGWARKLIMTVDVQGNDPATGYFYYVIRAWGYGYKSQLIDYGIVNTFDELFERGFSRQIAYEKGGTVVPQAMLIDSGNRTDEVYQFVLRDPARIKPTKGANTRQDWPVHLRHQKQSGLVLWYIDTEQTKDLLNRLMHCDDPDQWKVHSAIGDDYCQQMASEEKVFDKKTRRQAWKPKTSSTPNHLFDCEQQQCAAAYHEGLGVDEPAPMEASPPTTESTFNPYAYRNQRY